MNAVAQIGRDAVPRTLASGLALPRTTEMRRELVAAARIPYTAQVSETVVRTSLGDYVQVFQLGGGSFESADDETLNSWH